VLITSAFISCIFRFLHLTLFISSGSDVVNDRGEEAIAQLADVFRESGLQIAIEGYDNVPIRNVRNKDNWDLSVHRATSVAEYLLKTEYLQTVLLHQVKVNIMLSLLMKQKTAGAESQNGHCACS